MHYLKHIYKQLCYKEYKEVINPDDIPVFYWREELNLGDLYNNDLIKFLFPSKTLKFVGHNCDKNYLTCVGSILQLTGRNATILGSGFIAKESRLLKRPKQLISVRGRLTAKKLREQYDLDVQLFGDMGLIANLIFSDIPKVKKYKYGIIPHYKDFDVVNSANFNIDDALLIDIRTKNTREFLGKLNSCEYILSSSLHGLIFADSFGIPNQRLVLGDRIVGGDFKFRDYFSSVDRNEDEEFLKPASGKDIKNHAQFYLGSKNEDMLLSVLERARALF